MTAQIGADGLGAFGEPRPDLLAAVASAEPERGGNWVNLARLGFQSTQRLHISDIGGRVVLATWPAELVGQARHLYDRRLGTTLVTAALNRGWTVRPSPHLAYHTSPPERRLYMAPVVDAVLYAQQWEESDALRRVGSHSRQEVEEELWPWLKARGYADDRDDQELQLFLDRWLLGRSAHMRPGMRFRREWSREEVSSLGPALVSTLRDEFNSLFSLAEEPALGASAAPQTSSTRADAPPRERLRANSTREPIPERVRHEVWRRDQGRCVDCGSREKLEFDHIIPLSRGGSNTARNIELRCEVCNRKKAATV